MKQFLVIKNPPCQHNNPVLSYCFSFNLSIKVFKETNRSFTCHRSSVYRIYPNSSDTTTCKSSTCNRITPLCQCSLSKSKKKLHTKTISSMYFSHVNFSRLFFLEEQHQKATNIQNNIYKRLLICVYFYIKYSNGHHTSRQNSIGCKRYQDKLPVTLNDLSSSHKNCFLEVINTINLYQTVLDMQV